MFKKIKQTPMTFLFHYTIISPLAWDTEGVAGIGESVNGEFSIGNISAAAIPFPTRFQTPLEDNLEGIAAEN